LTYMQRSDRDRLSSLSPSIRFSSHQKGKQSMAKYKPYDYAQTVLLPVSLEEQLMPGTLEFAIHALVETRMDMSLFDEKYKNDAVGRAAYGIRGAGGCLPLPYLLLPECHHVSPFTGS